MSGLNEMREKVKQADHAMFRGRVLRVLTAIRDEALKENPKTKEWSHTFLSQCYEGIRLADRNHNEPSIDS